MRFRSPLVLLGFCCPSRDFRSLLFSTLVQTCDEPGTLRQTVVLKWNTLHLVVGKWGPWSPEPNSSTQVGYHTPIFTCTTWWWTTHESCWWVSSPQLCLWTTCPHKNPIEITRVVSLTHLRSVGSEPPSTSISPCPICQLWCTASTGTSRSTMGPRRPSTVTGKHGAAKACGLGSVMRGTTGDFWAPQTR